MNVKFHWVRQNSDAAPVMDGARGLGQRHATRNRPSHPQREDMPIAAGNLDTGDNVERVIVTAFIGPQAGIHHVVVGDGDDIERCVLGYVFQHCVYWGKAIAGGGVDV